MNKLSARRSAAQQLAELHQGGRGPPFLCVIDEVVMRAVFEFQREGRAAFLIERIRAAMPYAEAVDQLIRASKRMRRFDRQFLTSIKCRGRLSPKQEAVFRRIRDKYQSTRA